MTNYYKGLKRAVSALGMKQVKARTYANAEGDYMVALKKSRLVIIYTRDDASTKRIINTLESIGGREYDSGHGCTPIFHWYTNVDYYDYDIRIFYHQY